MSKKEPSAWKEVGHAGTLGIELGLSVFLLAGFGYWLDGRLGTSPILTIIGGILGMAAGLWKVYKTIVEGPEE